MFSLMDKVPSGIEPMLKDLEDHIISAGLADMVAAAETITTVSITLIEKWIIFSKLRQFHYPKICAFSFGTIIQVTNLILDRPCLGLC